MPCSTERATDVRAPGSAQGQISFTLSIRVKNGLGLRRDDEVGGDLRFEPPASDEPLLNLRLPLFVSTRSNGITPRPDEGQENTRKFEDLAFVHSSLP